MSNKHNQDGHRIISIRILDKQEDFLPSSAQYYKFKTSSNSYEYSDVGDLSTLISQFKNTLNSMGYTDEHISQYIKLNEVERNEESKIADYYRYKEKKEYNHKTKRS